MTNILPTLLVLVLTFASSLFIPAFAQSASEVDKPKSVLFVNARHSNKAKVALLKASAQLTDHGKAIQFDIKAEKDLGEPTESQKLFNRYDMVILDAVSKRTAQNTYQKYASIVPQVTAKIFVMKLPGEDKLRRGVDKHDAEMLRQYYDNGGEYNFIRMVDYLAFRILNNQPSRLIKEPIPYPSVGIYHPNFNKLIFSTRDEYTQWMGAPKPGQHVIGLNLQRSAVESAQTAVVDEAIQRLESAGHYVIPFFFELSPRSSDYSPLIQDIKPVGRMKTVVDVILNFRSIHWANKRKAEFEKFGVPVVQALTHYEGDQRTWEQSEDGIASGMMAFSLVLPESAGVIDPIVVAAMNQESQEIEVIDYQLNFLIERVVNYAGLNKTKNQDKRITTLFWGDRDMGASFLNVPESLRAISHRLNDEGYAINKVDAEFFTSRVNRILDPFYRDYQLDALIEEDLAELLPVEEYKTWLTTLPAYVIEPTNEHWGLPEENFMVVERNAEKYFVIPRIRNGNMLVMRQPPRGDSKDREMGLYHNTKIPMNHYYLAAYFYAREYWNSDAFIHLGTHGTHEYLPGKDRGLSRYDGANLSTGTLPVMYPYIVDDVGEAMQAKRRGNAITVGHMTPPFAAAGLQGVTADIHTLVDQYRHIDTGGVKEKTKQQIIAICHEENLCKDINYEQSAIDEDFDKFLADLHSYLEVLAAQNQPLGLHSFGELAEQRLIISTLGQMLGSEFLQVAGEFEKDQYSHEHHDHHHHEHNEDEHADHQEHHQGLDKISDGLMHFIHEDLENTAGYKTLRDFVVANGDASELTEEIKPYIEKAKTYYKATTGIKELDNLVAGLDGKYIAPKNGGDPVRHPESLPTGFNLIGFDPSRLPTKAAFEQGKELAAEIISNYYKKHGQYPDKLAFSLWSVEAMRHYGVLESQALYAMGVRPVWSSDGRVTGTEIIPASELKRPRVDVALSATGLYRDAFPNVMEMLAKAIKQLAELKEDGNSIWDNSQKVKAQLISEGVEPEEAEYLSSVRLFSNTFGDYGSGVDEPIMQSDTWETDAKIADNYLATMGFYFGADKKRWGQKIDNLYAKQLSGTDVAVFARSSNLYGMITSDDPFEYFGSLALAVRNIDGKSPEMMISNLRNPKKAKMELASSLLAKELRSRNFHKRWIQEMQKEGYSGAVTMSGNVSNFWGWQVVDPNVVRVDQWQEFHEIYIEDKMEIGLNEWFEEVNPGAQAQMIEKMLEAVRKDYWDASDKTQQVLIERYTELVNNYDLFVENEKLQEFVNTSAAGYGLSARLPKITPVADALPESASASNSATELVQGQKLEQVEAVEADSEQDYVLLYSFLGCLCIFVAGFAWQSIDFSITKTLSRIFGISPSSALVNYTPSQQDENINESTKV